MVGELNKSDQINYLTGKILEFQEMVAVIELENNQKILWPIKNLPEDSATGQTVTITIGTNVSQQIEREKIAKTILNQILRKEPEI